MVAFLNFNKKGISISESMVSVEPDEYPPPAVEILPEPVVADFSMRQLVRELNNLPALAGSLPSETIVYVHSSAAEMPLSKSTADAGDTIVTVTTTRRWKKTR